MNSATQNGPRLTLPVEIRFRAIIATWTAGENSDGERVLFPAIDPNAKRKTALVKSPDEIRRQFFKTDFDEDSALDFLNGVGVWAAIEDLKVQDWKGDAVNARIRAMRLWGPYGYRSIYGRALIVTVESLRQEQNYWRQLLPRSRQARAKLRALFQHPPGESDEMSRHKAFLSVLGYGNTLPIHLEWRAEHPHGVIQPVTGRELLNALAWEDLMTGAEVKVCQNANCGEEYTRGGYKFCSYRCEHANAMRKWRNPEGRKRKLRAKRA